MRRLVEIMLTGAHDALWAAVREDLRSKLGEEHAAYIHTVRSVGYRFGQSRWTGSPPLS